MYTALHEDIFPGELLVTALLLGMLACNCCVVANIVNPPIVMVSLDDHASWQSD